MRISTIAFANLKRRKSRALFLIVGMTIGIGTVVALYSLSKSIKDEIGAQLDQFGANIVVVPQANNLALSYGGVAVSGVSFDVQQLKGEDAQRIREIRYGNRIAIVAPKLLSAVEVEGQQALLAGVNLDDEVKLKPWWSIAGQKPANEQEVLVGYEVARGLSLIEVDEHRQMAMHDNANHHATNPSQFKIVRDRLPLAGREHRVAGVLSPTGGPEDRMIFGSLAHVQSLLGKRDQLSLIEVAALCIGCPVEDIVAQIAEKLPHAKVSALQQSVKAREQTVNRLTRFFAVVSAIVLAIGGLMIFTTMMGSVIERTKEIGVLRALGFRKTHIVQGLVIEVAAISVAGGLIGWAAGTLAGRLALPYFAETQIGFEVQPLLALAAVIGALLIGIASSLYPIARASRLDPSEAVRYV